MDADPAKARSLRALDVLAFLAPDVQGGVGPFLVVFMSSALHWSAGRVGSVMFVSAIVGLLLQAPAGAWIDRARNKPRWVAAALAAVALSLLCMALFPGYAVILAGQSAVGCAGTLVAPALAAISLGLVGRGGMDARIGRNTALTAAGMTAWALCTGLVGRVFGARAMFVYAIVLSLPAIAAALTIRNRDIDPALARGADPGAEGARWRDRRLAVLCACALLFHLANAAMLTLVAQEISGRTGAQAPLYMSASLVITQLMTMGIGLAVSRWAGGLPRKPIFLLAFLVLPLRAALYLLTDDPVPLVALQFLDGIGAGVFGVMQILVVGDLTRGSGHFNLGLGIVATAVGIGAAFSNLLAGAVAGSAGYNAGFVTLGAVSLAALLLFALAMPETRPGPRR
jgi:predicted MFS family arabinose efflux permease